MHLSRNVIPKTNPRPLFDRSCTSFDLEKGRNKGPRNDAQTLIWAQNTVNNCIFKRFHYFSLLFLISSQQHESLTGYGSKQGSRALSAWFWGSNNLLKVAISLRTSFENRLFEQCASRTSPKVLLNGFQTAQVFKMKLKEAPKASPEAWFGPSCIFRPPRGATKTLEKWCGTMFVADFLRSEFVFGQILRYFWNVPLLSWLQIQLTADEQVTFNS